MAERPPQESEDNSSNKGGCAAIVISLPFLLLGALIIVQAMGGPQLLGRSRVPPWALGLAGLVFFSGGAGLMLRGMGAGEAPMKWIGWLFIGALAAIFHYAVFVGDLSGWSGTSIGSLSAGEVMRIGVAAADLFLLLSWILYRTTFVNDEPGPVWGKWDQIEPEQRKRMGCMVMTVPLLLAIALHYTGVLDRIGAAFGQHPPGEPVSLPATAPAAPLSQYAGWWDSGYSPFAAGWVTRIIVRVDGHQTYMQPWQWCPPQYCSEGEHRAKIIGNPPHQVFALELTRVENGITRTLRLTPDSADHNRLMINERRIRGKDWDTHQQNLTALKRVK